ncbi:RHS repeat-associated core domain-containing protein [Cellulophaga sp. L1A9]|uniref:RHS repeat-associated core domain-containing protein n=1 Tax=Cellulophaga sp. L1A9 TaxID=2686362 RepID=UPI001E3BF33A
MADCPFRYQGQYEDVETGLYYNRFRYYAPDQGIYISQDPIGLAGNNPNLYAYTFDSNSEVDPFGLDCSKAKKIQNEISQKTSSVSAAVTRWLKSSDTKWAKAYRHFAGTNPNFAKLIKGRVIDRRMNKWMKGKYEDLFPVSSFDKTIPGSGRMRPDAYFPDLDGQSAIFDIGGSSKTTGIGKYDGLADIVEPIIW